MKTDKKIIIGYGQPEGGPQRTHTATVHRTWVTSRFRGQKAQPGLAQSVCIHSDEHVMEFPNYSTIYKDVWLGNLDVSYIKDAAAGTSNIQAHQPHTFSEITVKLICIHNFKWEDWYSLSKAWFHLFLSTPTFCEQHTNDSCVGKVLILYNSTMFYSTLFKTNSSRSSLLISFHVPQLPLILSPHSVTTWTLH